MRLLTCGEVDTVAGGRTNGDDPFVKAVMAACFCESSTTTTRDPKRDDHSRVHANPELYAGLNLNRN
jgi:hypothetical protein